MKNMSARDFQKAYLRVALISLLVWILTGIPGLILILIPEFDSPARWIGGGLIVVAGISLSIFIRNSIKGRKRFDNLSTEFYQEELTHSLDVEKNFDLDVIVMVLGQSKESMRGPVISPSGISCQTIFYNWNELARPQMILYRNAWHIAFGKDSFETEAWTGFLVPPYELIADLVKHYKNEEVDDRKFQEALEEQRQIGESTSEWGKNELLILEMAAYYLLVFATFIAFGVFLEFRIGEGAGVMIGTFLTVIGASIGYPLFFKNRIKSKYLLNKIGFGHAKGKRHFFLPWDQIDTIVIDGKHLFLHFHEEQNGEFVPFTIRIAYNRVLVERMKELQTKFDVKVRIRSASNEENE